jgi:hypothetical protein
VTAAEPLQHVVYTLDEGLDLLAGLEDARDALLQGGYLVVALSVEDQVRG